VSHRFKFPLPEFKVFAPNHSHKHVQFPNWILSYYQPLRHAESGPSVRLGGAKRPNHVTSRFPVFAGVLVMGLYFRGGTISRPSFYDIPPYGFQFHLEGLKFLSPEAARNLHNLLQRAMRLADNTYIESIGSNF
jgi:hypothetical protein